MQSDLIGVHGLLVDLVENDSGERVLPGTGCRSREVAEFHHRTPILANATMAEYSVRPARVKAAGKLTTAGSSAALPKDGRYGGKRSVIGGGAMASASRTPRAGGANVTIVEIDDERVKHALASVARVFERSAQRGAMTPGAAAEAGARVGGSTASKRSRPDST